MTILPGLDSRLNDLGRALGLISADGQLDSRWFDAPAARLAGVLADDARRNALVRFVEAVLGDGSHTERDGVTLLPLLNLRTVADDPTLPDLRIQLSLDPGPSGYVEVGLAATIATTNPVSSTDVLIPLYRAAKPGQLVAQPFALLDGAPIHVALSVDLDGEVLAGLDAAVLVPVTGDAGPSFRLQLRGLRLPGAAASTDVAIDDRTPLESTLLRLVLGVVKQAAGSTPALDLLGLGDNATIPPLPVDALLTRGVGELRDWFAAVMGASAARSAWLDVLRGLLAGTLAGDVVQIPIGAAAATLELRTGSGPGGHLLVTPRLGVTLGADAAGSIRLAAEAYADLFTVDVSTGGLSAVPAAAVLLSATGTAGNLVQTATVQLSAVRLGVTVPAGRAQALLELDGVTIDGHPIGTLDLTSPAAIAAAAGQIAATLLTDALAGLGDAGTELAGLLGLTPPAGVNPIDAETLLTDPLGALRAWWHTLITQHPDAVPAVLDHLLNLVAAPLQVNQSVGGTGTVDDPWSIPIATRLRLDCWRDEDALVLAPTLSLRVGDLAGGCTTVLTSIRAELATIDLAGGHAAFLTGVAFGTRLRNTGETAATISLGSVALTADYVGVQAQWRPGSGLTVGFAAPNAAAIVGTAPGGQPGTDDIRVPLVLPTVDAAGQLTVPPEAWQSVQALLAVLAAGNPGGWFADLVQLAGWSLTGVPEARLPLADLIASPGATLRAFVTGLITDSDLVGSLVAAVARLTGGNSDGRSGVFTGSGTPDDPWLAGLGLDPTAPAIAVWLGPSGPVTAAVRAGDALTAWRPGTPGLGGAGLAQALLDEGGADDEVALLAAGRDGIGAGLQALAGRWAGTDGLVAPPTDTIPGLRTVVVPDAGSAALAAIDLSAALPDGVPGGSVVVRVAATPVADLPWTAAAGRLLDLTAPGLSPNSYGVDAPATGDWVVALASRGDASLGASDPTGVLGQAARLSQVLGALAGAGPIVLIAYAGAGHAARVSAADTTAVTTLVTLGAPWSAVTFDSARTGIPADALRLLAALLPPADPDEPDDPDLAAGRGMVGGFMDAARGRPTIADLEAPRPALAIRDGLTAVGVFGAYSPATVDRAITAIVAAGLAGRARSRAAAAAVPTSTHLGVRLPLAISAVQGGDGLTVTGSAFITIGAVTVTDPTTAPAIDAAPALRLDLQIGAADGWLVGGPGTTPVAGALPLELRRLAARVEVGLHGAQSAAQLLLGEGTALGAQWASLRVRPPAVPTGITEVQPLLPEAQAVLTALTTRLATAARTSAAAGTGGTAATSGGGPTAANPAAVVLGLLRAAGVVRDDGALVPDGLAELLHDPGGVLRANAATALAATAPMLPGLTVTGRTTQLALGPVTVNGDLDARSLTVAVTADEGLARLTATAILRSGAMTATLAVGDPSTDAFALEITTGPFAVRLARPAGLPPVPLWPVLDTGGLTRLALAAIPAEALRAILEGLRPIDYGLGTALDDLTAALGMLAAPDSNGNRAIRAPVLLFEQPARWFTTALGAPYDAEKVIDLLEAMKPFVRMAGTPRGTWPIATGLEVAVAATTAGPALTLGVDATSWLAGLADRPSVAAGLTVGIVLPSSGAPRPTVEAYLGVPDGPEGTSSAQHRSAAHLVVDATGIRLLLRPTAGADVELYPTVSGLGALIEAGVTALLPRALNELAKLSGDATRTTIAALVTATGRGLGIASTADPAIFDQAALTALAADPGGWLRAHIPALLGQVVGPVGDLLHEVTPAAAVGLDPAGTLTVSLGTVQLGLAPAPFAVTVAGATTGLPLIGDVGLSLAAGASGLTGWSVTVGPATIDLDGVALRPLLRAGTGPAGWRVDLGLDLGGGRELLARWRQGGALGILASTAGVEDTSGAGIATAAIDAVLELAGAAVLAQPAVAALLTRPVGSGTVGAVLQGVVLNGAALVDDPLGGWPGKLTTLARQLAAAAPKATIGDLLLSLATTSDGVTGLTLGAADGAGLDLVGGGDLTLRLEVDSSWIDPPTGPTPPAGVLLALLASDGTIAPGITVAGVGLRLSAASGPLIDSGLRLDSVAMHLFAALTPGQRAGGVQIELGGLAVPLGNGGGDNAVAQGIMRDAGGAGSPPRPALRPSVAVQDFGTGTELELRAGTGDGPWYLPIQRAFGPVYLEQVGLATAYQPDVVPRQLQTISLLLDGQVSLLGLTASVERLRFSYQVGQPFFAGTSWSVDVDGFAVAGNIAGLTLAGALARSELAAPLSGIEYLGMLKIGFGNYGVDLYGGYAHPSTPGGDQYSSFFAFGVLHAPIGGPPAFFVTGIGVGLGINRQLGQPTIDQVNTHPFMLALRASGPTPDPMQQLRDMRALVPPAQGQYWVAAGLSFTSFVLITGEVLVTVQFGDGLEVGVLGLARTQLPDPALPLVSVELALQARFSDRDGLMLVAAQLTQNSYLLDPSARLTGGFAFESWWKGPNAGQFVVTVGGYHPRFHHDGYPVVPRVGLRWSPSDDISIVGGGYFALCSEAIMAGLALTITAEFGPAHLRLDFGADGIVLFDPFWYDISAYATVNAGITIDLFFGSVDVEVTLGVDVEVTGPPLFVTGHFSICGVGIPFEFGDRGSPKQALDAADFAAKYLRGQQGAQTVQANVLRGGIVAGRAAQGGQDAPPDGSAAHPLRVSPEFVLTYVATAPASAVQLAGPAGVAASVPVPAPGLGVAPMSSATLASSLAVAIDRPDGRAFDLTAVSLVPRPPAAFPKGVWGTPQNPKAPTVPAGDTIGACDGLSLSTVLPDKVGAQPIDYHQIELPRHGRKELPLVTNRSQTDRRVAQTAALRDAAGVLIGGDPDPAERFVRAAKLLAAGGAGRGTVASLRGDRTAAPLFGSLADDLANSPDAFSPPVQRVVVNRDPPPPKRFPPLIKSLLGVPLALSLDPAAQTTVAQPGGAVAGTVPSLSSIHATNAGATQAVLDLVPRPAAGTGTTLSPVGAAPLTRLASGSVATVANARPAPVAAARLSTMTDGLTTGQAVLHEGELAILTVASRPMGATLDMLAVSGGATRVLSLAAGGRPVADHVVGADGAPASVELPQETERVAVVALGGQRAADGSIAGWCSGQSLPALGWGAALAGGAVVTAHATRVGDHRERADGGWVTTAELGVAAQVTTVFTDPIEVVAIAVDDYLGADAAAALSMRLLDATRATDRTGTPLPPQVLVDGVRTILIYVVTTTGPEPGVLVDGCRGGQLTGVVGGTGTAAQLAALIATTGLPAAVRRPLLGGPGQRGVSITLGDGPIPTPPVEVKHG